MTLSAGDRIGRYVILSPLGAGGMGEVYRARDTGLDREIALKVLPADCAEDGERLARFEREARAAASLDHPNILAVHDVGSHHDVPFLVTELLDGSTLSELVRRGGLSLSRTLEIAVQVASGLEAAHAGGVVHRDLKSDNVFLTADGRVKILDFGLARLTGADAGTGSGTVTELTGTGTVLGTAGYMAPEQVRGQPADERSDVFSFGAVLYELLSGRRPFEGGSAGEILTCILHDDPPSLGDQVPPAVARIVKRCLEKRPEDRFANAHDVALALEAVTEHRTRGQPRSMPVRGAGVARSWRSVRWAVAAASLAAGLAGGWWLVAGRAEGPTPGRLRSLAVLPFANLTGDAGQEYFVDGMHQALLTDLSKIGALRVISRGSVMGYRGTQKTVPEIASELGVDAVVEGSVLRAGDRVRIAAELVDAATDSQIWAGRYDRDLRDVLRLHSDVARTIAERIEAELTPRERARLESAREVDPGVYKLYLKGVAHRNRYTKEDFLDSVECFEQVIARDPSFAPAYVALADAYAGIGVNYLPYQDTVAKFDEVIRGALAIGDESADVHLLLAQKALFSDWDFATAETELVRALDLEPSSAMGHLLLGQLLMMTGRPQAAAGEMQRSVELDPLSHLVNCNAGFLFNAAGQPQRAFDQAKATREMFGTACPFEPLAMAEARTSQGRHQEAVALLSEALETTREADKPRLLAGLGYAYAVAGARSEAERVLGRLDELAGSIHVDPYVYAPVYSALGSKDEAFARLELAYQTHSAMIPWIEGDIRLAPLRDDPRFARLVERIGLPLPQGT